MHVGIHVRARGSWLLRVQWTLIYMMYRYLDFRSCLNYMCMPEALKMTFFILLLWDAFGHLRYHRILRYLRTLLDTNGRFPRRQEAENMTFIDPSGASRSALVSHEEVEAWVNGCHGHRTCSLLNFDAEKVTKPGADIFQGVGTHN